eukprot:1148124-Pelagomonas_calceolata.AAC.2
MESFWFKDSYSPGITHFGAVGNLEWRYGGQKVGLTPPLIRHVCPNWDLPKPSATETRKLEKCPQAQEVPVGAHICREHKTNRSLLEKQG